VELQAEASRVEIGKDSEDRAEDRSTGAAPATMSQSIFTHEWMRRWGRRSV